MTKKPRWKTLKFKCVQSGVVFDIITYFIE